MEVEELFVTIEEFPLYEVSNYGRVIEIESGDDVDQFPAFSGLVVLFNEGMNDVRACFVHNLVAEAFFLNYDKGKTIVNHKNGNNFDNSVFNLTLVMWGDNTVINVAGITQQ
jgi:hypothetical protein